MHSCQSPWRLMTISSPITWTRAHNPIYPFPFLSTLTVTLGPRLSCSSRTSLKYKMYKRMGEQELAGIRDVASRISCLDLLLYEICNPTCQLAGLDTINAWGKILHIACTYEFMLRSLAGRLSARGRDEHNAAGFRAHALYCTVCTALYYWH
jgi:hypothetical protein